MIKFLASQPIDIVWEIDHFSFAAAELQGEKGVQAEVPKKHKERLISFLDEAFLFCEALSLPDAKNRISLWKAFLEDDGLPHYYTVVGSELSGLKASIATELSKRTTVLLPVEKVKFCDQDKLFSDVVYEKFPKARADIKNAGNCLAMDLHDAAVFHLMLVMNNGLLALARYLSVHVDKKPLEYEEWHTLIGKIEKHLRDKIKPIENDMTAGKGKDEELDFYQGLLDNLKYTKDAHRNPIAHARGDYDETKALAVFNDVRRFMERLAKKVSE